MESKLEVLKFNMERIDGYIEKADNKANFLLAFNGIVIGIIFSNLKSIMTFISSTNFKLGTVGFLLVLFLCFILSIIFSLLVLFPRKSKDINGYKSILYYKNISTMSLDDYKQYLNNSGTDEKLLDEFCKQVIEISIICNKKMNRIKQSMVCFIIGSTLTILLIILYVVECVFIR